MSSEGSRSGARDASLVFSGNEDRAADPLSMTFHENWMTLREW